MILCSGACFFWWMGACLPSSSLLYDATRKALPERERWHGVSRDGEGFVVCQQAQIAVRYLVHADKNLRDDERMNMNLCAVSHLFK